jgi:hypothetical protein
MNDQPVSKVLVLDNSPELAPVIKSFCEQNNLFALKVRKDALTSVLKTNIDLGGILYSENYGDSPAEAAQIALDISRTRPELPIIIRREKEATLDGLPESIRRIFCAAYVGSDMEALRKVVEEYIFCLVYPNSLLRGIAEISTEVLGNLFKGVKPSFDTPYIVHDRMIFGEVFSLIQLESSWCRGYMMLQTEEEPFTKLAERVSGKPLVPPNFRRVNDLLSEITNMIWGGFKNRYIGDAVPPTTQVQVPLIVNHKHDYISFGTSNPQLCFRLNLDDERDVRLATLQARFIFNLNWSPEYFKEVTHDADNLVESGALELF